MHGSVWIFLRKFRFHLLSVLLFTFIIFIIESICYHIDRNINFRVSLENKFRILKNEFSEPFFNKTYKGIAGLEPDEILIRIEDSEKTKGIMSLGRYYINPYQKFAQQKKVKSKDIHSTKNHYIIGESAGFGFPYKFEESFSYKLLEKLKSQGHSIFNVSQPGINSVEALKFSHRIINEFPKTRTLIFYLGNNVFIGWFPPIPTSRKYPVMLLEFLTHKSYFVAWSTYQGFKSLDERDMKELFSRDMIGLNDAIEKSSRFNFFDWKGIKEKYLTNFEEQMLEEIKNAKSKNIKVVLLSVPYNFRLTPIHKHPQPLALNPNNYNEVHSLLKKAEFEYNNKKYDSAMLNADLAIKIEPETPLGYYIKGLSLEQKLQFSEAEIQYSLSREHMMGNLGSIPSINKIIEKIAHDTNSEFIDLQKIFVEYNRSQNKFFNEKLIDDDCHPTPLGHQIIAEAILKKLGHFD